MDSSVHCGALPLRKTITLGSAMILNRLLKNWKKLSPWAKQQNVEAFRLYDRDIPEFPFIVDLYGDHALVYDKSDPIKDKDKNHLPLLLEALPQALGLQPANILIKRRQRQEGLDQYEKLENRNEVKVVREGDALFEVNLYDYLDTGLFLDHRPLRQRLLKETKALIKQGVVLPRVLNLFCYTGSVSVFAALGGARVTSVDMSATYLDWAQRNFKLNQLDPKAHDFIQKDVLQYLDSAVGEDRYDLIFLDPPTFSNSKRMTESFEVERDQNFIVEQAMKRLRPKGILFFSNNKRGFRLSPEINQQFVVKDITAKSIPMDFHDQKIHHAFEITARSSD